MVSDWLWVSRQRASGRDYTFVPYSTAVGALMVAPDAGIRELGDLKGKRLGIAGGPVDKSWLLLRAYSRQELGKDIKDMVSPNFAAPPLLNELALRGELPAVLNFWHYSARLKAAGLLPLLPVKDLLPALGVKEPVPLVGWIFREHWAEDHLQALTIFLNASYAAKKILAESDAEWERLRPMLKVANDAELVALRDAYRAGIPNCFDERKLEAAKQLYAILVREGGRELVGTSQALAEGTFWRGFKAASCQR
jgi:NitT/TauT family transport system substrate-binding protein